MLGKSEARSNWKDGTQVNNPQTRKKDRIFSVTVEAKKSYIWITI